MTIDPILTTYFSEISKSPLLTRDEELELARLVQHGDPIARERMICSNLKLVAKIASDYVGLGLSQADLIEEGNIGLMTAVERFDPSRGAKFSTYAVWWIKQYMRRALSNQSRTIRIPSNVVDRIRNVRNEAEGIAERTGRRANTSELKKATGLSADQLRVVEESKQMTISLDDETIVAMHEHMEDEGSPNPSELAIHANLLSQLPDLLGILTPREHHVIESRFGLGDKMPRTLDELGLELGVSRERIRQIQKEALKKMRAELRRKECPLIPTAVVA